MKKKDKNIKDGTPQRDGAQLDDAIFHAVIEVYVHRQVEDKNTEDLEKEM